MQTSKKTLTDLLSAPQHLSVPMFQRAYAWDEEGQWQLLWEDVEHLVALAATAPTETHFLGAIVLQRAETQPGGPGAWDVIDGQQRLTTLQVLLDAVAGTLEHAIEGGEALSGRLTTLTENPLAFRSSDDDRLKLTPTTRDQPAFVEVMTAEAPVDHSRLEHRSHKLAKAHRFFSQACIAFLEAASEPMQRALRASQLVEVLLSKVELVVISLEQNENAQSIFETLNARMTPLQPTDLIKNFVFQHAVAEGADVAQMYETRWRQFEDKFWETEVRQGQLSRPRFTLFTNHWLSAMLRELVPATDVFRAFKKVVQTSDGSITALVEEFVASAQEYRRLVEAAEGNGQIEGRELTVYRLQAADVGTFWPLFIYVNGLERRARDEAQVGASIDRVFAMVESWVVRKVLLGHSLTPAPRFAVELVQRIDDAQRDPAGVVEDYLMTAQGLGVWPDDAMLEAGLPAMAAYKQLKRSRLRMVLEALEDDARGFVTDHARTSHARMTRHSSQVEHIMPEAWRANWPLGERDEAERDRLVHSFGNLALLPQRFNASVGNLGWGQRFGDGKREAFRTSSTDLLLRDVLEEDAWDEAAIERRTERMVEGILHTWPVPEGHEVVQDTASEAGTRATDVVFLLERGKLHDGDELHGAGRFAYRRAIVRADGSLEVDGRRFDSPTAAAKAARGDNRTISGTWFWRLSASGQSLMDMRVALVGWEGVATSRTDTRIARQWEILRRLMDALPSGRWTSYGDLATVIGTHANPLGQYIAANPVPNPWRVLQVSGAVSPGFTWRSELPQAGREPLDLLREEGVPVEGERAAQSHRLSPAELRALLSSEDAAALAHGDVGGRHTPATLADELGTHPKTVREVLREHPTAARPAVGAEWEIDDELADWVRARISERFA